MIDHGIKISKKEKSALGRTLQNLLFDSPYPMLKIKKAGEGSISYTHDGAGNDITITTHGLGYKPLFRLRTQWFNIDTNAKVTSYRNAPFIDTLSDGAVYFDARPYVTDNELRFAISSFTGSGSQSITLLFYYKIYYDIGE